MPLSKHLRFCLWWESFFNGGHFSTCQTRKKSTPVTFFLHMRYVFLRPGVISLRRKMTPRSIFDGGRYSSLHPSRNILDFVYGGSHFSTGVIFLRVRHVKNRPLWHFFYTWDTFFYGQGSFLYDEKWPLGRFSTGVVIRRYTGIENVINPHKSILNKEKFDALKTL